MRNLHHWLGILLNALRVPGFVRDSDYRSARFNTRVRVRCGTLFTVVTVNGLDMYFHRLTGRIDGVGIDPSSNGRPPFG